MGVGVGSGVAVGVGVGVGTGVAVGSGSPEQAGAPTTSSMRRTGARTRFNKGGLLYGYSRHALLEPGVTHNFTLSRPVGHGREAHQSCSPSTLERR
ncbi:MAG: hypothetical protein F4Y96_07010 [Chloroflexi bacterium]|nr:hypothetical protein [Chloroflexota bacterium]